jgi:hypothetical protein
LSAWWWRAPGRRRPTFHHDLARQSDARLAALGFTAAEIAALRQGRLQLPIHKATPTSA